MNPITLVVVLSALPAVLMATAHVYAMATQDRKARFVILLLPGARLDEAASEHARRHRLVVERKFPAVNAYTALVPLRSLKHLEADSRVLRLERREIDEFDHAAAHPARRPVRRTA